MSEKTNAAMRIVPPDEVTEEIAKHLPLAAGNPHDVTDEFAIDQSHMDEFAMVEEGPAEVECARPPKGIYFTVFLETGKPWQNRRPYFLLEIKDRDPFLVAPEIAKQKKAEGEDTIRPVLIVRYVTMAGEEGLWALKLDPPDGKTNAWNRSALKALKIADEGKWVRLMSGKGHYTHTVSPKTLEQTPPRFSARTFKELLDSAFAPEQRVRDGSHEIWTILSEGSEK